MELRLLSPYGMFHVSGAGDVLSRSNGFNGDIGFIQSIEFGPLELLPAVGAYWSDARYNSYYYGVTRKEARKSGLGAALLAESERVAREAGATEMHLHSQCHVTGLYERAGYERYGTEELDEHVPHIWMKKPL